MSNQTTEHHCTSSLREDAEDCGAFYAEQAKAQPPHCLHCFLYAAIEDSAPHSRFVVDDASRAQFIEIATAHAMKICGGNETAQVHAT